MFYTKITVNNRYANGHALVSKICRILHGVITSSGVNIGVGFPGYQHDKDRPEKSVLGSRVSLFGEANDILYLLEQPAIEKLKEKHMIMISTIDRVPENAEPIVFRRNQSFTIYSRLMKYLNKIIKQPDEYMGLDIEEIDNLINKGEPLRGKNKYQKIDWEIVRRFLVSQNVTRFFNDIDLFREQLLKFIQIVREKRNYLHYLPFVQYVSQSNGHAFRINIEKVAVEEATQGVFNRWGLSENGTTVYHV